MSNAYSELVKDYNKNSHPWDTNDGVYFSTFGTPCRIVSHNWEDNTILLEFAYLTTPELLATDNPRIGHWTIIKNQLDLTKFLNNFRNA
jgi:hypothetical protein